MTCWIIPPALRVLIQSASSRNKDITRSAGYDHQAKDVLTLRDVIYGEKMLLVPYVMELACIKIQKETMQTVATDIRINDGTTLTCEHIRAR